MKRSGWRDTITTLLSTKGDCYEKKESKEKQSWTTVVIDHVDQATRR